MARMAWVKDLLTAGTYHPPGADPVTFTLADLRRMERNGSRMLANQWTVPVCVEHQDQGKPVRRLSRAEARARGFLCFTSGFRVTPDGTLQAYGDDPEDADDAKLLRKLQFVSPEIRWDWKTGDGVRWPGPSITHLALTPTPVNNRQRPFQRLSMQVRLSMADFKGSKMADEKDDAKIEDAVDDVLGDETQTDEAGEAPEADAETEADAAEAGDAADTELTGLFEQVGLFVPTDAMGDIKQFKSALLISLKTKLAADGADGEDAGDGAGDDLMTDTGEAPAGAEPAPNPPPAGGGLGLSMSAREEAYTSKLIETGRGELRRRLKKCYETGRIPQGVYQRELTVLAGVRLSLDDRGDVERTDLAVKLDAWEESPASPALRPVTSGPKKGQTRLSAAEPAPIPADRRAAETPEDARRVNDEMDQAKQASKFAVR